jgi:SAM-dependent methyltransferase
MENVHQKVSCRICGSSELATVLDLGTTPLANAFLTEEQLSAPELVFPLAISFCPDCASVQLTHTVDGSVLFKDYHYETAASRPLVEHFHALAEEILEKYATSPDDLVVEIGSNDGSLLSRIKGRCRVLGVDPAANVASTAIRNGVPTIVDFFTLPVAKKIQAEFGKAQVIVANNVMAHIDDIRGVFAAVKELLTPDGRFIFEVHWVGNLLTEGGFDQIYHEHIYYHSLHALKHLVESLGMVVKDVTLVPIHGESMRVSVALSGESSQAVHDFLGREVEMGLTRKETFLGFGEKIEANRKKLVALLASLKKEGKRVVGYGAPAKGNTLLNYFRIGPDALEYITDTTLAKQGTYTPGTHIRVVSPEALQGDAQPDYVLLLSWNYADAILAKEEELRARGVKFIIPVPEVRIV